MNLFANRKRLTDIGKKTNKQLMVTKRGREGRIN